MEVLASKLRDAKPSSIRVDGNVLYFRGGLLRPVNNWNLLVSVTSAEVVVVPHGERVDVNLRARVTQLWVFCVLVSVFLFGAARNSGVSLAGQFCIGAMAWGWLFGMNFVITRSRLANLLRRTAAQASAMVDADRRLPERAG